MLKDRLKEIIAIVEESGVEEVEISTWWGRKIRVRKNASGDAHLSSRTLLPAGPPAPASLDRQLVPPPEASEPAPPQDSSNHRQIPAPIVGTFYRAPTSDSQPFIEPGDRIEVGQVICIIEAMKIMNEIESDVGGTVVDILIENGTPVEFNQPLVVVDPS